MLQRPSANVLMYLKRAAVARERAKEAETAAEKRFHNRLESAWMNLAASTACVEHVDLFLHTIEGAVLPYNLCPSCHGLMVIEMAEILDTEEVYGFHCLRCGAHDMRSALPRGAVAEQVLAASPRREAILTGK